MPEPTLPPTTPPGAAPPHLVEPTVTGLVARATALRLDEIRTQLFAPAQRRVAASIALSPATAQHVRRAIDVTRARIASDEDVSEAHRALVREWYATPERPTLYGLPVFADSRLPPRYIEVRDVDGGLIATAGLTR